MANYTIAGMSVRIRADLTEFTSALERSQKKFEKFGDKLNKIGEGFSTYVTLPLAAIGAASLKTYGDIQALEKGLIAVAGSSEEASKQFKELREVAKLPGLGLKEAVQGSINLQAAGFSADLARRSLTAFGNALATVGKGKADLDGVNTALSQIASKGTISAEEINQIAERVPQIRKVMQEAFGTSNTEVLQKMGIDATTFVEKVVTELEKLPPVAGGINIAFENLSDSVLISLSTIGESINETFKVEERLSKLAGFVEDLANKFNNLSPATKRFIVIAAAIAAAIGPALLAIGFFTGTILPALTAGLAAVTGAAATMAGSLTLLAGPVGLVVAAVAGAALLIIKNWDAIKEYFTTGPGSTFFNKLKDLVTDVMDIIQKVFKATVKIALDVWDRLVETGTALWDKFGSAILKGLDIYIDPIVTTFKYVFNQVLNIIDFFANIFQGNWSGVWQNALKIIQTFSNFVVDLISKLVTGILGYAAELAEAFGADFLAEPLNNATQSVEEFAEKFKVKVIEVDEGANKASTAIKNYFANLGTESEKATKSVEATAKAIEKVNEAVSGGGRAKNVVPDQLQGKESTNLENSTQSPGLTLFTPEQVKVMDQVKTKMMEIIPIGEQIAESIEQAAESMAVDFGKMLGTAIATGEGFKELPKLVLATLGDLAIQVGKLAIQTGIAIVGIKKALQSLNPYVAIAAGVALIALGAAVKASLSKTASGGGGGGFGGVGGSSSNVGRSNADVSKFVDRQSLDINIQGVVKGEDLAFIMEKNARKKGRVGG